MSKLTDYPFEVRPLTDAEGGGYLISFPDFAECISDGESVEEAIEAYGRASKDEEDQASFPDSVGEIAARRARALRASRAGAD